MWTRQVSRAFLQLLGLCLTWTQMIESASHPDSAGGDLSSDHSDAAALRNVMYLTGQHPVFPSPETLRSVTHVALAFMASSLFTEPDRSSWPLFTSIKHVRAELPAETKVTVAIGGWGDTEGFSAAARTPESRVAFAGNVARMVDALGVDGVDVDWEYPGGNGEDYKEKPNSAKAWEIEAYPLMLAELRKALGPDRVISAAVPGLQRDMLAFTRDTVPQIIQHLDFLNVMAYDLMNRRDKVTKHHTGVELSRAAVEAYIANGAPPHQLNLGFAFYVKYFKTEHEACRQALQQRSSPLECPTLLLEGENGEDLGRCGSFSWHDTPPDEVADSFARALAQGRYDEEQGGYFFWDEKADLWWTFDTADAIKRKYPLIVVPMKLGGVFAWALGEDAPRFEHFGALIDGLEDVRVGKMRRGGEKDEL